MHSSNSTGDGTEDSSKILDGLNAENMQKWVNIFNSALKDSQNLMKKDKRAWD